MKPFSGHPQQQTLFTAPKPTAQHRWPRGYTPERMDEVRKALPEANVRDLGRPARNLSPLQFPQRQRQIYDTLARSTAPTEDFSDAVIGTGSHVGWEDRRNVLGHQAGSRSKGTSQINVFEKTKQKKRYRNPSAEQERREHTLIHEIGHHTSDSQYGPYRGATKKKEEAFARGYDKEHWRPEPRTARRQAKEKAARRARYASTSPPTSRGQLRFPADEQRSGWKFGEKEELDYRAGIRRQQRNLNTEQFGTASDRPFHRSAKPPSLPVRYS